MCRRRFHVVLDLMPAPPYRVDDADDRRVVGVAEQAQGVVEEVFRILPLVRLIQALQGRPERVPPIASGEMRQALDRLDADIARVQRSPRRAPEQVAPRVGRRLLNMAKLKLVLRPRYGPRPFKT